MRISDCGFKGQSRERKRPVTDHGPRITNPPKPQWPNKPISSQTQGRSGDMMRVASRGVALVAGRDVECCVPASDAGCEVKQESVARSAQPEMGASGWCIMLLPNEAKLRQGRQDGQRPAGSPAEAGSRAIYRTSNQPKLAANKICCLWVSRLARNHGHAGLSQVSHHSESLGGSQIAPEPDAPATKPGDATRSAYNCWPDDIDTTSLV